MNRYRAALIWIAPFLLAWSALPATAETPCASVSPCDGKDYRWSAINNRGDVVWSVQDAAGHWQVQRRDGGSGAITTMTASTTAYSDFRYPGIDDNGNILVAAYGTSLGQYFLVKYPSGSVVEFSSKDPYSKSHRDAGRYSGLASNGNAIWYYEFFDTSGAIVGRRLSATESGQLLTDIRPADLPSLNANRKFTLAYSGKVELRSIDSPGTTIKSIDGNFARLNDQGDLVIVTGTPDESGKIRVLSAPNYDEAYSRTIGDGVWAHINTSGMVVYQTIEAGKGRIWLASPPPATYSLEVTTPLPLPPGTLGQALPSVSLQDSSERRCKLWL